MSLSKLFGEGVTVDTQLFDSYAAPGGILAGIVRFTGGSDDHDVEGITLAFDVGELLPGATNRRIEFHRVKIHGPFPLAAGAQYAVPFQLTMPWETPVTDIAGTWLKHLFVEVRTELSLADAMDSSDADLIRVVPMPIQHRIFEALRALGHELDAPNCGLGMVPLKGSALPVSQHLAFDGRIGVGFVAGPASLDMELRHSVSTDSRFDTWDMLDIVDGSSAPSGTTRRSRHTAVWSTVDYSWIDEDLDWEGWIAERVAAVRSVR